MVTRLSIVATTCFFLMYFPQVVYASVFINEVAWMGTSVSGTNEWIELANDTPNPVSLSGWQIEAGSQSSLIALSGTIEGNGYFLIERTDDRTVSGIRADLIAPFGKGLGNSGNTLFLKDTRGVIVDTVEGGVDWKHVGGNNVTKETAQRVRREMGEQDTWVTATATPCAKNNFLASSPPPSEITFSSSPVSQGHTDTYSFVGIPFVFNGGVLEHQNGFYPTTYEWNFGDGTTGVGQSISHTYQFVGTYRVVLRVSDGQSEQREYLRVVVAQPPVSISQVSSGVEGFVEIDNQSSHDIDISGWILSSVKNAHTFKFADRTYLSANQKTIFPNSVTGMGKTSDGILLSLRNGTRIAGENASVKFSLETGKSEIPRGEKDMPTLKSSLSSATTSSHLPAISKSIVSTSSSAATVLWERTPEESSQVFGKDLSQKMSWFFVSLGMILLLFAGLVVLRSGVDKPSLADEYAIVSDLIEGDEDEVR